MLETNICQYYPHWFRRILDFQALCHTEGQELRFLAAAMEQIHKNLFVQTMDEDTCAQWETILRIIHTPDESLDFRRMRVLNRLSLRPPFTMIFLRERLDMIFGPGNYVVEMDYPSFTLCIEASVNDGRYFSEVSALLGIVKPCHIVYVSRPRIDGGLLLSERTSRVEITYNYIQGAWALGEKPFVSILEQEVLKMETTSSIQPAFLSDTAAFTAQNPVSARVNGSILIDKLTRMSSGNIGSVIYTVSRNQTKEITLVELLGKDGSVLASSQVYLPVLEEAISLRHSFQVKEGV